MSPSTSTTGRLLSLRGRTLTALLLALALCACGTPSGEAGGGRMDVELDVFSGRPNPEWRLSESDATTFLRKVAALPGASTGQLSGDLGYRGFVIRVSDGTVAVQNGTVRSARGGTTAYRQDPNRDLERWLLGTGHQVLDREVLTLVEGELPP